MNRNITGSGATGVHNNISTCITEAHAKQEYLSGDQRLHSRNVIIMSQELNMIGIRY